ncbi:MAG: DUF5655 domain-containing protein [Planctomycetaceae bacterium]
MAQSPQQMTQVMRDNMQDKTGRTLDQWLKIVARSKLEKHGQIIKHLKSDHGVTHGYANMIAQMALQGDAPVSDDKLIADQYAGGKAELRPLYESLAKAVLKFGKEVEMAPKKSYVSLRRNKQFAIIQPSTKTRIDVGLNLKGVEPDDRLEAAGSFNAMVSHRVRVTKASDIDKELVGWLRAAYERS